MDLQRYQKKMALGQVRFVERKGEWFLEFDKFDTETGAPADPEHCPVNLEKLQAMRQEIEAEIAFHDKELAQIAAAKARQEGNLAELDKVIADLQAAQA